MHSYLCRLPVFYTRSHYIQLFKLLHVRMCISVAGNKSFSFRETESRVLRCANMAIANEAVEDEA